MKNVFTIFGLVLLSMLLITGCGSTKPLMSGGEYQEPGFFMGIFGGLLWPFSLLFMGIGKIFPSFCGDTALYYHYNSGFGYWLGYCIGLFPYLGLLRLKSKGEKKS